MRSLIEILQYKEVSDGTELIIKVPKLKPAHLLIKKLIQFAEIRFDDGRHISAAQRKKAYATIRDIADYTGYLPEELKEIMKYWHIERTGDGYFSLSSCSMDTAREFINTILEFALEWGIPLSESGLERTDDIGKYLYHCIIHKRCAICGKEGEIHHIDTIGMGNNRKTFDDSDNRKICLCRKHHTIAHQRGVISFQKMYHVYGILVNDVDIKLGA